ncbi:MAG TPA: sensor histidine kinase [Candidatus Desulfobacillus sp.]|nr:sensor histidine kinase [Candidatus Desulfobacillus sp.]
MSRSALAGSLRLRLLAGTLVWILCSLALAGWGLRVLFQDHVSRQLQAQLLMQLDYLSGAIDWGPDGRVAIAPMAADARLAQPLSGLYWQIDRLGSRPQVAIARSRSLWDQALDPPAAAIRTADATYQAVAWRDAQGRDLLAVLRTLQLPEDDAPPLRLIVAGDKALIAEPVERFTRLLLIALGMLALGLVAAAAVQLQLALRPLRRLRQGLAAVRAGQAARLEGEFPRELQPLVEEFNHVLTQNVGMVEQARAQTGNLAHAIYTPLSILANAAARDGGPLAALIEEQAGRIRRQVEYQLARSRATAVRATGLSTPARESAEALLRTMRRLHEARRLDFQLAPGAEEAAFRGEAEDLYEMLGNLLDNAGKWARSRVVVDVRRQDGQLLLSVDDDGPGIPPAERERIFERGVQLDERRPGAGLGLDIARTLAESYGGSVQVLASPLGGARLQLHLPLAG